MGSVVTAERFRTNMGGDSPSSGSGVVIWMQGFGELGRKREGCGPHRMGADYISPNERLSHGLFMQLCIIDWPSPGCTAAGEEGC